MANHLKHNTTRRKPLKGKDHTIDHGFVSPGNDFAATSGVTGGFVQQRKHTGRKNEL